MQALAQFTERFGSMLSRVLLTVLYFGVLGPFALVYQRLCDPLHQAPPRGNWTRWESTNEDSRRAAPGLAPHGDRHP